MNLNLSALQMHELVRYAQLPPEVADAIEAVLDREVSGFEDEIHTLEAGSADLLDLVERLASALVAAGAMTNALRAQMVEYDIEVPDVSTPTERELATAQ